ncbi:MAG: hypothetical protein LBN03_02030 [Bifidobacteriaceae bacterium]|jgi:tight adherence protein B|nr:hypothetical protein [Bifidobacteriaceae bacterium]
MIINFIDYIKAGYTPERYFTDIICIKQIDIFDPSKLEISLSEYFKTNYVYTGYLFSKESGSELVTILEKINNFLTKKTARDYKISEIMSAQIITVKAFKFAPIAGILLCVIIGINPISLYFGSAAGFISVVVGIAFYLAGLKLINKINKDTVIIGSDDLIFRITLIIEGLKKGLSLETLLGYFDDFRYFSNAIFLGIDPKKLKFNKSDISSYFLANLIDIYSQNDISLIQYLQSEIQKIEQQELSSAISKIEEQGVKMYIPIGLCMLPSFIFLSVVPMAINYLVAGVF